ncbi:MAG: AmmeMemoRadiSam system protein A [Gammaproteobacteria bacterium]|nr:MAG: AmmeMemoRadiSam system protein A [Gammaproteobacteria bacterium]
MAPMSSTEYDTHEREQMLEVARRSITHGLEKGAPLRVDPRRFPEKLQARRACFVTLNRESQLRGCIGHLEPVQTLIEDVAENAFAAAFRDPRFPPLQANETADLEIHISVLSEPEPLPFEDEQDLLAKLRPGVDGLILEAPLGHRGTFLPSVWEQLPHPRDFLAHLRLKAGLPADFPLQQVRLWRYTTESFEGHY